MKTLDLRDNEVSEKFVCEVLLFQTNLVSVQLAGNGLSKAVCEQAAGHCFRNARKYEKEVVEPDLARQVDKLLDYERRAEEAGRFSGVVGKMFGEKISIWPELVAIRRTGGFCRR